MLLSWIHHIQFTRANPIRIGFNEQSKAEVKLIQAQVINELQGQKIELLNFRGSVRSTLLIFKR